MIDSDIIQLENDQKNEILNMLQKDSLFLKNHGLMDYSLLLAVETLKSRGGSKSRKSDSFLEIPDEYLPN